jgi:hypothetical protein
MCSASCWEKQVSTGLEHPCTFLLVMLRIQGPVYSLPQLILSVVCATSNLEENSNVSLQDKKQPFIQRLRSPCCALHMGHRPMVCTVSTGLFCIAPVELEGSGSRHKHDAFAAFVL